VLKEREVGVIHPHFAKTKVSDSERFDYDIVNWIKSKLKGRYFISHTPSIDYEGKLRIGTFIGFEEEKELTYFMLACPYLRRN